MSTTVRVALAALLVLTGASASATLTASTAPRTVVQADEQCTPPECLVIPPRDPETQRQVDALIDAYTAAFATLKTTKETHS